MTQTLTFCRFSVSIVRGFREAVYALVRAVRLNSLCALWKQLCSDLTARLGQACRCHYQPHRSPHKHSTIWSEQCVSRKASVFVTGCILPPHLNQAVHKRSLAFVHSEQSCLPLLTSGFMAWILRSFKLYCILPPLRGSITRELGPEVCTPRWVRESVAALDFKLKAFVSSSANLHRPCRHPGHSFNID